MRILHTCHTYRPSPDGVAIVMQRVSEGLVSRGHEVTVATTGLAGVAPAEDHAGVQIRRFDVSGNAASGCSGATEAYSRFVASFPCDVMLNYAAQICTTDLVLPLLAELDCRKVIAPCGYSGLQDEHYAEYFSQMPAHLRAYDAAVYHSQTYQDARFAADNGLGNSVFINNGADAVSPPYAPGSFRNRYAIPQTTLLLSVGRLEPPKGQDLVVEAFRLSKLRDAALVLVAPEISRFAAGTLRTETGPFFKSRRRVRAALYELVERHLPGRAQRLEWKLSDGKKIYILTHLPRHDVLAAYADADLFVFGSRVECSPLVIIEAMAAGTPFISMPVGNVPDLPGGMIVRDTTEMAAAIDQLAQKGEPWRNLSQAGRAAWERDYTWDHVVDQYERLYQELLTRGNA